MLSAALKSELTRLSMPDRLEALEFIRSTVLPPANGFSELTSGQKNELLRRARAAEAHPEQGRSWEEVKRRIAAADRGAHYRLVVTEAAEADIGHG